MSEVQKFDPSQLMQGVRDRIKATFVSLIPDEQWEGMIKNQADDFFREKDSYTSRERVSDFSQLCRQVMNEVAKIKVIEFMETYQHEMWNNTTNEAQASEALKKLLINMAPEMFAATMGNMIQKVISEIKQRNY